MRPLVSLFGASLPDSHALWFEPLKARLRAAARAHLPYWVDLDASGSRGGIGGIECYRFWVVDHRDRLVVAPRIMDGPRHGVALPPGRHHVFLCVTDRAGATDVVSTGVTIRSDVRLTDHGALVSTWGALTTVDLPADATSIDLNEVLKEASGATDSTAMWIQAFGATGGYGQNSSFGHGGQPGAVGFAQIVTSLSDFTAKFGTTVVYYYLGDNGSHEGGGGDGGASTLLLRMPWSTSIDDVVVIAGGGGGGGAANTSHGHDGGGGAIGNGAQHKNAITYGGGDGGGELPGGGGGEFAGYQQVTTTNQPSTDGVGGWGGTGSSAVRKFTNGSAPGYDGTGRGGNSDGHGGAGGGGWGGGGSGINETTTASGGGGGGSYTSGSTRSDSDADNVSTDSGSASGVVRIVFNLSNSSPASL